MLSKELLAEIGKIDNRDDIVEAWDILKRRHNQLNLKVARQLHIGQKVEFDSKHGYVVVGKVTKINAKTVSVKTTEGLPWRVSASLLRPAK